MRSLCILAVVLALAGCANGPSASDLATAQAALQEAGCAVAVASAAAAPIIAVTSDEKGAEVLQAASVTGQVLCQMPKPATITATAGTVLGPVNAPAPVATPSN